MSPGCVLIPKRIVDRFRFKHVVFSWQTKINTNIRIITGVDAFLTIQRFTVGRIQLYQTRRRLIDIFGIGTSVAIDARTVAAASRTIGFATRFGRGLCTETDIRIDLHRSADRFSYGDRSVDGIATVTALGVVPRGGRDPNSGIEFARPLWAYRYRVGV